MRPAAVPTSGPASGSQGPQAIKAPTVDYEGAGATQIAVVQTIYMWDATTEIPGPDIRLHKGGAAGWEIDEVGC